MRACRLALISISFAALLPLAAASAQTTPAYKITKTVTLGSPEQWDYLVFDPATHDVYVSHGDRVTVVDGRDGRIVGTVDGIKGGPHGFGIVSAAGKG